MTDHSGVGSIPAAFRRHTPHNSGEGLVALLGHPVGHSLSPVMHNAAFAALGISARYEARDVPPAELPQALAALRAERWLGANLTIPHKLAVLDLVDRASEETRLIGAANTLYWAGDDLVADNTDARGLETFIRQRWSLPHGARAVIAGSGGAARAAAVALARLSLSVTVLARRPVAAESVAETAAAIGVEAAGMPLDYAARVLPEAALVVNATSLGMHGEALPEPFLRLGDAQIALDLVYGGPPTPFVAAAQRRGLPAADGLGMLIAQAGLAFTHWTGQDAPLDVMASAAAEALEKRLKADK